MKKNIFLYGLCNLLACSVSADEIVYPIKYGKHITELGHDSHLYFLKKNDQEGAQLFAWNMRTKKAHSLLPSFFIPSDVSFFPDDSGFSFNYQSRVRIKKFNRRSPKTIAFQEPVYDFSKIEWVDEVNGYCSAKKYDHYGIFHISCHGDIQALILDDYSDYLYPQKCGDTLFYIRCVPEGQSHRYIIGSIDYPYINYSEEHSFNFLNKESNQSLEYVRKKNKPEDLIDFGTNRVAFLLIMSDKHGFCIQCPETISREQTNIDFSCHALKQSDTHWQSSQLFSFKLPVDLAKKSMLQPFLPRYEGNNIFFSSYDTNECNVALFRYKCTSGAVEKVSKGAGVPRSLFGSGICCHDKLFYGGNKLALQQTMKKINFMDIDEFKPIGLIDDENCFDFPHFKICVSD